MLAPPPRRPRPPDGRREQWEATIRALWDGAAHREEWYAAIALARHRAYRGWLDSESMPLWQHLSDRAHGGTSSTTSRPTSCATPSWPPPDVEGLRLREWAADESLWVRRAAILSQVGVRDRFDPDLLTDVIEPNLDRSRLLHPQGDRLGTA